MMTLPDVECQRLVDLVTEYMEGTLAEEERARFDAHLDRCSSCSRFVEQMWQVIRSCGRLPPPPSAASQKQLMSLFRQWKATDTSHTSDE
jgi:anti-sigma factor RsiW